MREDDLSRDEEAKTETLGVRGAAVASSAPEWIEELGAELVVLLYQPVELRLNFVEEGVYLSFVVAWPEPGGGELLVPHIQRRQAGRPTF